MILLVVAAGLIAPRVGGQPAREARAEAEAVTGLLSTFADQLSTTGSVGGEDGGGSDVSVLQFDAQTQSLAVARRLVTASGGRRKGEWTYEPLRLVPPVVMERTLVTQVLVDGRVVSAAPGKDWRVTVAAVDSRPVISLTIAQRREGSRGPNSTDLEPNGDVWQIDLGPTDSSATMRSRAPGAPTLSTMGSESVDLDLSGAGDTPW